MKNVIVRMIGTTILSLNKKARKAPGKDASDALTYVAPLMSDHM